MLPELSKTTPETNQPTRGIHRTFQTRGPGKTGQMPSAYQISKLYKVHSLFKNFKFKQAFPVRVRWLPADLKFQKPEQHTKQRYTQICTSYIHSCVLFHVESSWKACHVMKAILNYHLTAIWDPISSTDKAAPSLPSVVECSCRVQLSELCRGKIFENILLQKHSAQIWMPFKMKQELLPCSVARE